MPSLSDSLVAGQQTTFKINFTSSFLLPDPASGANAALQKWPPFANGLAKLNSVSTSGSQLVVTFTPNPAGSVLTYGNLASAIADYLNQQLGGGAYEFDASSVGAGLGTTSFWSQFEQEGGITLSPLAPVTPGGSSSTASLILVGLAILAGILVIEIL